MTTRTKKKRKPAYVYLATGPDGCKIGLTADLNGRSIEHRHNDGRDVAIVWSLWVEPDAHAVELGLLKRFASKRVRGEWHALDAVDVVWLTTLDAAGAAEVAASWKPTRKPTGTTPRTGCKVRPVVYAGGKKIDESGKRYGRWLILDYAGTHPTNPNAGAMWNARCDCGTLRVICRTNFAYGGSTSCGCLQREKCSARRTTHGRTKSPEYSAWRSMRCRCHNPDYFGYKNYGARGIVVCERWRDSFENFLADMGERPSPDHSLDRNDNSGPYSPENCVWATAREQINNRRNTRFLTLDGVTKPLTEWARDLNISRQTIASRIRYGWPVERILTATVQ